MAKTNPKKVYLITGANRGIGFALVKEYASKDPESSNIVIFAGVRDPSKASELRELAEKYPKGKIEIVRCVSGDVEGNKEMAKVIEEKYGYLDVVIANAGIANYMGTIADTPISQLRDHFEINATSIVVLFQSVYPLLKANNSDNRQPKFITISSGAGSLVRGPPFPIGSGAYGASKAALNFVTRKIHFENPWIVAFPFNPGPVTTDMAESTANLDTTGTIANLLKKGGIALTPEECAEKLSNIVEQATREKEGGEFIDVDGSRVPW